MAVTTPDNIVTPDDGDPYALVQDLGALADSVQDAITEWKNYGIGTDAERLALTSSSNPPLKEGLAWFSTDTTIVWRYDGSSWLVPNSLISLKNNTPQALAAGVVTDISFQEALSNRGFAVSLPVTSVTIPSSGIYEIAGALTCTHVAASFFDVYLTINGADVQINTGSVFSHVNTYSRALLSTASYSLSSGDIVKMRAMSPRAASVDGNSTSPGAVLNIKRV